MRDAYRKTKRHPLQAHSGQGNLGFVVAENTKDILGYPRRCRKLIMILAKHEHHDATDRQNRDQRRLEQVARVRIVPHRPLLEAAFDITPRNNSFNEPAGG